MIFIHYLPIQEIHQMDLIIEDLKVEDSRVEDLEKQPILNNNLALYLIKDKHQILK